MAKNKSLRIIIDTNLWISFLISDRLSILDSLLVSRQIQLLFSKELLHEIQATSRKPKLQKFFSHNAVEQMLMVFSPYSTIVEISSVVQICRDPNDDFLLALATDGKADFLLTGDNDLLEVKEFEKTRIVRFNDFISSFQPKP